jgi:sarcosine oxidase, subunit delta
MLAIPCPHCGPRAEIEFVAGGEVVDRPFEPSELTPQAWFEYATHRPNTRGIAHERWWHSHGCRQWFSVYRDTTTNRFVDGPRDENAAS